MNIYLIDTFALITIIVAIYAYRTLYGWKFVLFPQYPALYIFFYTIIFGLPLIYNLYMFLKTRNDPSKDRPITSSKWMGALFIFAVVVGFNVFIARSLK